MTLYNKINNITGWVVFIVATAAYIMTAEATASFWDCGEFISCAWKMQIAHSPGAPLFLMLGRIFTMFGSDNHHAANMVNLLSNIMGGLTSLFLFWTITALAIKVIGKKAAELSVAEIIVIMGSGIVGALASTFSDSTWFSTVEGEVYASSAAFTAFVVWGILKWEANADTKYGDRWILLVAYAMGLSIGVHLLNLLCIPAMVFVFYFKRYPYSRWGMVKTFFVSVAILGGVQYGIIQSIPYLAANADILFVDTLHLPFNSGSLFFMLMLITALTSGILFSHKGTPKYYFAFVISLILTMIGGNPLLVSFVVVAFLIAFAVTKNYILTFYMTACALLLGFLVNPFASVVGYIVGYGYWYFVNRERDEDPWNRKPSEALNKALLVVVFILIGYSSYTMVLIRATANTSINMSYPKDLINLLSYLDREQYGDRPLAYGQVFTARPIGQKEGDMKYWKGPKRYEEEGRKVEYEYRDEDKIIFPRVFDEEAAHVNFYKSVLGLADGQKPTQADNLKFFMEYQVNWMYWRYFMWNFAGRQNDIQGTYFNPKDGNWISGLNSIPIIGDNSRLGSQDNLPPSMANNKAKNKFYFLPLLLGLIGMFFHFRKKRTDAFVVLLLFFWTGLAIVLYLNQTPQQPRERDYAYQGSVYAFTIWIGLGVLVIFDWIRRRMNATTAALLASTICMIVPFIMAAQGWDDHDRSHRYTCRDFGKDYLESCAPNAILFTQGDNDTYPLWYAQEVENIRPDIRIVNLSLLGVDWYIDNLRRKVNESAPVDISIPDSVYRGDNHNALPYYGKNKNIPQDGVYDLKKMVAFMISNDPANKERIYREEKDNYLPAKNVYVSVDKKTVIENGTVQPEDTSKIVSRVQWTISKNAIYKPSLILLDIIQNNNWKRPIYFAYSVSPSEFLGLNDYMQQEGLAYRLVPLKQTGDDGYPVVQPNVMYNNMKKFAWGGVDKYDVYLDETVMRMVTNLTSVFARLAEGFVKKGDNAKAVEVLDQCLKVLPEKNVPYSGLMVSVAEAYYKASAPDKGKVVCNKLLDLYAANMKYFTSPDLDKDTRSYYQRDMNEAVYVFNQIGMLANGAKQKDLGDRATDLFSKYKDFYYSPKQQQQQQQQESQDDQ